MSALLNLEGAVIGDDYSLLADDAALPDSGAVIVSLARWQAEAAALAARADAPAGVSVGLVSPRKARLYCLMSRSDPGCIAFSASARPTVASHFWQKGHW